MIDLSNITTLLFDIDNTLLLFDDHEFNRFPVDHTGTLEDLFTLIQLK